MPHCGYPDVCVEEMYKKVSAIIREARARKRLLLMAGDWNAEVQSLKTDRESDDVVGQYANDCGNQRGDWLRRWATAERMLITNTCFKKRWGQRWTHEQNSTGRRRQIDYIFIDKKYKRLVMDAGVEKQLVLGSDHRAVKIYLIFRACTQRR